MEVKCSCLSLCQWPDLTRKLKLKNNKLPDSAISDEHCLPLPFAPAPTSFLSAPQLRHLGGSVLFRVVGMSARSPGDWSPGRRQLPLGFSITSSFLDPNLSRLHADPQL